MNMNEDSIRKGVARYLESRRKRWDEFDVQDAEDFILESLTTSDVGWRIYDCLAMLATKEIEEVQQEAWGRNGETARRLDK